ncbi:MAG: Hsp20/alpha crystallin family protein [Pseudomonadota bacterium]
MLLSSWDRAGWDPFGEMQRLKSEMNQLLNGAGAVSSTRAYPPVNLWLGDNSVVVTAELPGLSSEDIDISIAEDTLTISGKRALAANDNQVAWRRRERPLGAFSRTIELPFRVDPDRVEARCTNGVLEVEMHRPQADLPRKIQVKTR